MKRSLIAVLTAVAMTAFAGAALAEGHGHGPGGPGAGDFGGPGGNAVVGSDGTLYLTSMLFDSSTNTATTTLKAISPSGSVKWTLTLSNANGRGGDRFVLSGSNLLSVDVAQATDGTFSSIVSAIATSTGAAAWTQTIPGRVQDLIPFNGGTYAVVITPATTAGGPATRSLVAISDSGAVLWTITV